MSDEKIEGIGEKKKSMQDIIDMMQAQIQASASVTAGSSVDAPTGKPADPGLRMVNGPKKGVIATANAGNSPIQLDPPRNTNKASAERVVVMLQAKADSQARVESQKRQEGNAVAFAKKYASQKNLIWNQVAKDDSADGESASTKAFRWIMVAAQIAAAIIASVATGGAAVGLIVGAAMALATAIAEESGGTKALKDVISLSLQQNNGMTKKEADAAAGQITDTVLAVVQTVASCGAGAAANASESAAKEVIKVGMNEAARGAVSKAATEATGAAVKSAESAVKAAEGTLKGAQEALKGAKEIGGEALKTAEQAVKDAQTALNSAQKTLESAKEFQGQVKGALNEIAEEAKEAIKKAADDGVEIVQKNATEAVDNACTALTDKLTAGLKDTDPAKLAKVETSIKNTLGNIQRDTTDLMTKAEKIAKIEKGLDMVGKAVQTAKGAVNLSDRVNQIKTKNEVEVLKAQEEVAQTDMEGFNEKLSAEYETEKKSFNRISNLMDTVVQMADSHEKSLQEATMWV